MSTQRKKFNYKGVSVNLFGLPEMNKKKVIKKDLSKRTYLRSFTSYSSKEAPKNLILMYDVPDLKKKERDWLRRQLKNFGFIMIQKSVWVGPSPLPNEFLVYLKGINLQKDFKTFKLAKAYTGKSD